MRDRMEEFLLLSQPAMKGGGGSSSQSSSFPVLNSQWPQRASSAEACFILILLFFQLLSTYRANLYLFRDCCLASGTTPRKMPTFAMGHAAAFCIPFPLQAWCFWCCAWQMWLYVEFTTSKLHMDYEGRHGGELWITFDHLRFLECIFWGMHTWAQQLTY